MGAVLDELFTERPLALLIMKLDFIFIISLLFLINRIIWKVQHDGLLTNGEIVQLTIIITINFMYILGEVINLSAKRKLGLPVNASNILNMLAICLLFTLVGMCFSEVLLFFLLTDKTRDYWLIFIL
jgi:hypothetical protein